MSCFCRLLESENYEQLTSENVAMIAKVYQALVGQGRLNASRRQCSGLPREAPTQQAQRSNKRRRPTTDHRAQPFTSCVASDVSVASKMPSPTETLAVCSSNSSLTAGTPLVSRLGSTPLASSPTVVSSSRTTRTDAATQQIHGDRISRLLAHCKEDTVPLLVEKADLWIENPVDFMNIGDVDVERQIQHPSTINDGTEDGAIVAVYNSINYTSAHCKMLKWMLAMLHRRLFHNCRHGVANKPLRRLGNVACRVSESAGYSSIVLLVPFSSWIHLTNAEIEDTAKRLKADAPFLELLRRYEAVTQRLLSHVKGCLQPEPIFSNTSMNPYSQPLSQNSCPLSNRGSIARLGPETQVAESNPRRSSPILGDIDDTLRAALSYLLPLLVCLNQNKISLSLLQTGSSCVRRWDDYGEPAEYSAESDGMDEHLLAILRDSEKLDQAISGLINSKHICMDPTEHRTISVLSQTVSEQEKLLTKQDKLLYWRKQAVQLIERLFHERDAISPRPLPIISIKKYLLPHLEAMVRRYPPMGWPKDAPDACIRLLCAGSFYKDIVWKERMLEEAGNLASGEVLKTSTFLFLALRKAKVYRLKGELKACNTALEEGLDLLSSMGTTSPYERAQYGLITIDKAESLVHRDDHKSAIEALQIFQAGTPAPSSFETMIQSRMWIMEGRICRYVGEFGRCEEKLLRALSVIGEADIHSRLRLEALQELADLYVDTKPEAVESLISKWPQHTSPRLQIARAESLLELGELDLAEQKFKTLGESLQGSTKHFCLLRVNVGLARISHQKCWDDPAPSLKESALKTWSKALAILTEKFSADGQGRTTAIVLLSSCDVASMQGEWDAAKNAMNQVHYTQKHINTLPDLHQRYASQYWVPGLGSKFYDRVRYNLKAQAWDLDISERTASP